MEHSVQSRRREERVPLHTLIELHTDDSDEVLEADGLDLSPGGLSMRAAFVPPVGARLHCQFRCDQESDLVRAEGEVMWSEWRGVEGGCFGMRFLALDTKSATAIRHHVEPEEALFEPEPELPRCANMRIEGLGVPIEADVLYADQGSIVLEQDLTFLKLGRGVSIELPGRANKRGRIASVELRHGPLDVPTLVFGILLDEQPEAARSKEVTAAAALNGIRATSAAARTHLPELEREPALTPGEDISTLDLQDVSNVVSKVAAPAPAEKRESARKLDTPRVVRTQTEEPAEADEADPEIAALTQRMPPALAALGARFKAAWVALRAQLLAFWASLFSRVKGESASLREEHWPDAKSKLAVWLARVRLVWSTQRDRLTTYRTAQAEKKKRKATPAPRVQRSSVSQTAAGAQPGARPEAPARVQKPRNRRLTAMALAAVGVGLGVYALAPRSGADRIRTRRPVAPLQTPVSAAEPAADAPAADLAVAAPVATAPVSPIPMPAAAAPVSEPAPAPSPEKLSFGEASVPNGRTFSLRMSGPVESVEGERREDGFTIRVPGRLALDRASPIATSHRAVARAMILNRGDYAELTVDFLPGLRPKYQVVGHDATLEVTLERL